MLCITEKNSSEIRYNCWKFEELIFQTSTRCHHRLIYCLQEFFRKHIFVSLVRPNKGTSCWVFSCLRSIKENTEMTEQVCLKSFERIFSVIQFQKWNLSFRWNCYTGWFDWLIWFDCSPQVICTVESVAAAHTKTGNWMTLHSSWFWDLVLQMKYKMYF